MHSGGPGFVIAIVAMSMIGWVLVTAIRAKHGYPLNNDWGGWFGMSGRRHRHRDDMSDDRKVQLLTSENERLTGQVGRLEERIAVLERIATDPAERTAREIDALRDR